MPRTASILALFVLVASIGLEAQAQIVAVRLADAKTADRYKKHTTMYLGEPAILCEPYSGITVNAANGALTLEAVKVVELFVLDPARPERAPYKYVKGQREPINKRASLSVPREDIRQPNGLTLFSRTQTLGGLASEYKLFVERLAVDEAALGDAEKGSKSWFDMARRVVESKRRLVGWLNEHGFDVAAKNLEKDITRDERSLGGDAVEARRELAMGSIRAIEAPADLHETAAALGAGDLAFRGFESRHLRIFYPSRLVPDEQMKQTITTAERVIEGFRRQFVDPWVGDDFPDHMPDDLFAMWLFVPEDRTLYERFYTDWYGGSWDRANRERQLDMSGSSSRGLKGVSYNGYWKIQEQSDFECMVVNNLGKFLANIHFNGDRRDNGLMDWIGEGTALYLCLEFLGRNTVTTFQFAEDRYGKQAGDEGEKSVELGQRDYYNELAVSRGIAFSDLVIKSLHAMDDPDRAKSWSFFDYLAHEETAHVNRILRSACTFNGRKGNPQEPLREEIRAIFDVPMTKDPLRWLDDAWMRYARGEQKQDRKTR